MVWSELGPPALWGASADAFGGTEAAEGHAVEIASVG